MLPLEKYLDELKDTTKNLQISKLANFSELSAEEIILLKNKWNSIDIERRRQIVEQLVELTMSNYNFDFDDVFQVLLEDSDNAVKLKAVEGLSESDDTAIISPLLHLIKTDKEETTRAAATAAMSKFTVLAEVGKLPTCRASRIEGVLMNLIRNRSEQTEVRRRAIEAIAPLSRPDVKEIINHAYSSKNAKLKRSGICAMGRNCDPAWIPILVKELVNTDPELRLEAVVACGEIGAVEAIPRLIKLVRDPDKQIRLAAITSLGNIGSEEAKSVIKKCLNDPDDGIKEAASAALEEIGFVEDPLDLNEID
ncbi:MAG: HEAT repeat domain-containing protein [Chloroflexi bacterium]|nr:HEAT repeat domain-containing protein [Chloroflexota bacterium]